MKVAFLTFSISRDAGGLLGSMQPLSRHLARSGVDMSVLALEDRFSAADAPQWHPLKPLCFSTSGPVTFGYAKGLLPGLEQVNPDLIHNHGLWKYTSVVTQNYCGKAKKPYLVSTHGMLNPQALGINNWKKKVGALLYENRHLRSASCIHALSLAEARMVKAYGVTVPICQIPNGIDLPPAEAEFSPPPWLGRVPQGRRVLLYLGRIHPIKGIDNLVDGWSLLKRKAGGGGSNWTLVIAGWGQHGHESTLATRATELGLGDDILFLGPQYGDSKASCYHFADGFVLPSLSEAFPMVVLEAWAYGKPVLMTPQCNVPEGFAARAALRIEPEPRAIADGLATFFEMDDAERRSIGAHGLELVRTRFTWGKIASEMRSAYEWLLGGGSPPPCILTD
ncbi:glycosyltransferase [Geomesophilobacter sediminis]|uniref:Glycosyltransferase n=1 Tax=Geomesophilobacter sediminis TaxID=2798584 RepID=A0A8J7J9C4_9BACT|nr:glycosyltransferase [Geomesophilobacter sediminis]MBJ6723171.1 glycosyltransferase [Geomesophilobacter sediminis]